MSKTARIFWYSTITGSIKPSKIIAAKIGISEWLFVWFFGMLCLASMWAATTTAGRDWVALLSLPIIALTCYAIKVRWDAAAAAAAHEGERF